jgi:hypothetical protein
MFLGSGDNLGREETGVDISNFLRVVAIPEEERDRKNSAK